MFWFAAVKKRLTGTAVLGLLPNPLIHGHVGAGHHFCAKTKKIGGTLRVGRLGLGAFDLGRRLSS